MKSLLNQTIRELVLKLGRIEKIETIELNASGLESLDGIEACTGLKNLYVDNNLIASLEPLSGLNLTVLSISSNQVMDMSPLQNHSHLESLSANFNSISDIGVLGNLSRLSTVRLRGCNLLNVEALGSLSDLSVLDVTLNNGITSISSLSKCSKMREFYAGHIPSLKCARALEGMECLANVVLCNTGIATMPLFKSKVLDQVDVSFTKVNDVSPLKGKTALRYVNMSGCAGYKGSKDLESSGVIVFCGSVPTSEVNDEC